MRVLLERVMGKMRLQECQSQAKQGFCGYETVGNYVSTPVAQFFAEFTVEIGLKYYRVLEAQIKINCAQDTCTAARLSRPGRALHEGEVSDTRTAINQRNESSQELLLLVSENNLKHSCYLRSKRGRETAQKVIKQNLDVSGRAAHPRARQQMSTDN